MSDEYTPTTDEVRSSFGNDFVLDETTTTADALPMFDRWLAEHDREVAAKALEDAEVSMAGRYGRQVNWPGAFLRRRVAAIRACRS